MPRMKISRDEVQYSLQKQLETGENDNRKPAGEPKVTTTAEDKHLKAELNFSRQQPVSISTVTNRLRSAGLRVYKVIKKLLLRKVTKQKRPVDNKSIRTGHCKSGKICCGQTRPNLNILVLSGKYM